MSEPRTLRETRGPVHTFKVGARDILGVEREVVAAGETTRFRREHRDARIARRDGTTSSSAAVAVADGEGGGESGVEVWHRLDERPTERSLAARVVTLRDRRGGRPRRADEKAGSDPPG